MLVSKDKERVAWKIYLRYVDYAGDDMDRLLSPILKRGGQEKRKYTW
ncbi:hypothetical protein [Campylobacter pinnipediorum]|nr:hypothetical protein [Campylobacter pinnipediorum]